MSSKELYRDPINGKISGVCAGIANYFKVEAWLVRIVVISVTLLGGWFIVFLAYIAMSLMLENQPVSSEQSDYGYEQAHVLKQRPWKQGESPNQLIKNVQNDMMHMESAVRSIEAYVTSEAYKVNKAFKNL